MKILEVVGRENVPWTIWPDLQPCIVYADQWTKDYYEALDYLMSHEFVEALPVVGGQA